MSATERKAAAGLDRATETDSSKARTDIERWDLHNFVKDRQQWMDLVWADDDLSATTKLVAGKIAFWINQVEHEAFPSQVRISRALRVAPRTIERSIAELVERGWLTKWRPGRTSNNRYFLSASAEVREEIETYLSRTDFEAMVKRERKRMAAAHGIADPHSTN